MNTWLSHNRTRDLRGLAKSTVLTIESAEDSNSGRGTTSSNADPLLRLVLGWTRRLKGRWHHAFEEGAGRRMEGEVSRPPIDCFVTSEVDLLEVPFELNLAGNLRKCCCGTDIPPSAAVQSRGKKTRKHERHVERSDNRNSNQIESTLSLTPELSCYVR